ncbi:hypothetical protein [Bacteroides pyogenes]|uniref:Uncharacterized protein n=2 Tax=Bacteroides pyogenes TaxID=310300 RepID=W4PEA8_9BACE|nr:hypothetical protein [Bacteroides pyogenes]MCE9106399.1 hypothetical protein [Bacteroides pyogenes]MCF2709164.1 hypothetical protein [Bacteroides pyogenes]GAE17240.1 hypothetical protein JCM6292_3825 [Bacteroides pyogenes JCM 6292]GAE17718.1 hypothetical protein JCM6294_502 [Bacteroides pyogenes DSM 20611 = JCM 6294]
MDKGTMSAPMKQVLGSMESECRRVCFSSGWLNGLFVFPSVARYNGCGDKKE